MARNWICTKNMKKEVIADAGDWLKQFHEAVGARYTVGQLERGHEQETLHIQFFCNFEKPCRITRLTKVDAGIHAEKVLKNNGADTYCMKDDTRVEGPWQFGEVPIQRNKKTDWKKVWNLAAENKLEAIPEAIRVIHYNKLKQIAKDHMKPVDKDHLRGIWIYGPPGSGKSKWVRDNCKDLYPKLCNKWWDGYQGQKYVVMDDMGPQHECLAQQLKIWSDRYGCILEIKGGAVVDNYQYFFVTSQYEPSEIFKDEKDLEAINRRFQVFDINNINLLNLNLN